MYRYQYHCDFSVYPEMVDEKRRLRLTSIENILLNAASWAAHEKAFGFSDMMARGVTWVLSRLAIEMTSLPREYENLRVGTWVEDYGRMLTTRNFELSAGDNVLGHACSQWALIDLHTRKAAYVGQYADLLKYATGQGVPIARPARLCVSESFPVYRHEVRYSDVDFNGHVNSVKYLEWMLDALPQDVLSEKMDIRHKKRLDINYLHESIQGEELEVRCGEEGYMEVRGPGDVVRCRAHFQ